MRYLIPNKGKGFVKKDKVSGKIETDVVGYIYMEAKTIRVGEPMGLLLTLTYPNTFSFQGERI